MTAAVTTGSGCVHGVPPLGDVIPCRDSHADALRACSEEVHHLWNGSELSKLPAGCASWCVAARGPWLPLYVLTPLLRQAAPAFAA